MLGYHSTITMGLCCGRQTDRVSREVGEAMDRFLDTGQVQVYGQGGRGIIHESQTAIRDRLYQEGLWTRQVHYTGSMYEGMPQEVCSDMDVMLSSSTYPVVVLEPPGDSKQYQSGFVVANGNPDQPAYFRLKVTDMKVISKEIADIVNISITKSVVSSL